MAPERISRPTIRSAAQSERQAVLDVITLAFAGDPLTRWAMPNATDYLAAFPAWAAALGGHSFAHGTAYVVDDIGGAALWLPPGVEPDRALLLAKVDQIFHGQHRSDFLRIIEQMNACYPREPCWFLPLIGVDPGLQGRGYGSLLMRHALRVCDTSSSIAYLTSSNPRNVSLYQRHGFEIMGTIQVADAPPLTPMLRFPKSRSSTSG